MIAARDSPRNCAGGVTTEAICNNPLARQQNLARHLGAVPRHRADDWPIFFGLLVHRCLVSMERRVSPIFFAWVAFLVFSRARVVRRLPLPPVMSNSPVLLQSPFPIRHNAPIRSTKGFPIRNLTAAQAMARAQD